MYIIQHLLSDIRLFLIIQQKTIACARSFRHALSSIECFRKGPCQITPAQRHMKSHMFGLQLL